MNPIEETGEVREEDAFDVEAASLARRRRTACG